MIIFRTGLPSLHLEQLSRHLDFRKAPSLYVPLIEQCAELRSHPAMQSLLNVQQLFDQIPEQNVVAWTALIVGHVNKKKPESGIGLVCFGCWNLGIERVLPIRTADFGWQASSWG